MPGKANQVVLPAMFKALTTNDPMMTEELKFILLYIMKDKHYICGL